MLRRREGRSKTGQFTRLTTTCLYAKVSRVRLGGPARLADLPNNIDFVPTPCGSTVNLSALVTSALPTETGCHHLQASRGTAHTGPSRPEKDQDFTKQRHDTAQYLK